MMYSKLLFESCFCLVTWWHYVRIEYQEPASVPKSWNCLSRYAWRHLLLPVFLLDDVLKHITFLYWPRIQFCDNSAADKELWVSKEKGSKDREYGRRRVGQDSPSSLTGCVSTSWLQVNKNCCSRETTSPHQVNGCSVYLMKLAITCRQHKPGHHILSSLIKRIKTTWNFSVFWGISG